MPQTPHTLSTTVVTEYCRRSAPKFVCSENSDLRRGMKMMERNGWTLKKSTSIPQGSLYHSWLRRACTVSLVMTLVLALDMDASKAAWNHSYVAPFHDTPIPSSFPLISSSTPVPTWNPQTHSDVYPHIVLEGKFVKPRDVSLDRGLTISPFTLTHILKIIHPRLPWRQRNPGLGFPS